MSKEDVRASLKAQIEDIKKASNISSLILSTCMIDALAGFYNGYIGQPKKNKKFFLNFSKKYFPSYDAEKLYTLRCDVVHSFSNSLSYLLVASENFTQAFPNIKDILGSEIFNINKLKTDLELAFENYFRDLEFNPILLANFNKRLGHLGILKRAVIPTVTDLTGKVISKYEDLPELLPGLKIAMYTPTDSNK